MVGVRLSLTATLTIDQVGAMQHSGLPSAQRPSDTRSILWETIFSDELQEDDPVWKEYVEVAAAFDTRMVDEWNKTLDVILVFVSDCPSFRPAAC